MADRQHKQQVQLPYAFGQLSRATLKPKHKQGAVKRGGEGGGKAELRATLPNAADSISAP